MLALTRGQASREQGKGEAGARQEGVVDVTRPRRIHQSRDAIDGTEPNESQVNGPKASSSPEDGKERGKDCPKEQIPTGKEASLEENRAEDETSGEVDQGLALLVDAAFLAVLHGFYPATPLRPAENLEVPSMPDNARFRAAPESLAV